MKCAHKLRVIAKARAGRSQGDEAKVGLVRDLVGEALEHHGVAERIRGRRGLGQRCSARFPRNGQAMRGEEALGIELVERPPACGWRQQILDLRAKRAGLKPAPTCDPNTEPL